MKKNKVNILIIFIFSFCLLFVENYTVLADENLAVSVNAVLPDNQKNKEVTYYELRMKPGQKQDLDFELTNGSDVEQKVILQLNNATTNDVGGIDYSDRGGKVERDESLKIALTDVAKVPEEVTIKPKSTEVVKIKLSMPKEEFKGEILGGIRVTSPEEKDDKDKETGGMQIKNKVAYTVGISLTESDDPVEANLDLIKGYPSQVAGRNVVKALVRNNQATILEDIKYEAHVTKKGKSDILHKSEVEGYRFAPNSVFNFDISWENQPFEAGDYTVFMKAESKDTGQKWSWEKDFTIEAKEAKELNEKAVDLDKDNTHLYIIIGGLVLLLIIIIILLIVNIKRKQKSKKKKNRKKGKSNSKGKKRK